MEATELIELIRTSEKKTPARVLKQRDEKTNSKTAFVDALREL